MNLWFRLLICFFSSRLKSKIRSTRHPSRIRLRAWPSDCDFNLHITNGRYLSIADLGRVDLLLRTGLAKVALKRKWMPIVSFSSIMYYRQIRIWRRFELETTLCFWNEKTSVFRHSFHIRSGSRAGELSATLLTVASLYDPAAREFVSMDRLMEAVGVNEESPPSTPEIDALLVAHDAFKAARTSTST